ncbi:MAG: D-arabinono-1,4-lactone oxidase [Microlunatus sp.]
MSRLSSYLKGGFATTANVAAYAATNGRYVLLEGRRHGEVFRNWALRFAQTPRSYARPTTRAQIVEAVQRPGRLRVVGSGHSFNDGILTEDTLVSLDDYSGLVRIDLDNRQLTFRAGTRVRDAVAIMLQHGLAFAALPSHDAQSLGGILSTDVHGTGKNWGFVSESVVGLTIVDGTGELHRCGPTDDLFRAAIGGVGAVGIITEVVVQGVPRFAVDQRTFMQEVAWVRGHLDELIAQHDHVSLYLFPYAEHCQVNTWDRTTADKTHGGEFKEFVNISLDAVLAAWVGNFLAYARLLPLARHWSRLAYLLKRGTQLVLESDNAYNRTMYHLHQELEFTVEFDQVFEVCDQLLALYAELYDSGLPYLLLEVRFTPAGHDRTLLGAGQQHRCAWIDLIVNDSDRFDTYYAAAVELIKSIGGRPHLGKYTEGFDADYLAERYGPNYQRFRQLMAQHDPDGKFANAFTRRMFGTAVTVAGEHAA